MINKSRSPLALLSLLCVALLITACTRSATTQTLATTPAEGVGGGGEGVGGGDSATQAVEATNAAAMQALLVAGQTQTAQAQLILGPTSTPTPPPTPEPTIAPTPSVTSYTVKSGDWLYQIARDHNVDPKDLIAANPQVNPNAVLVPGTVLTIPVPGGAPPPGATTTGQKTYVVKSGDNLFRIALNNNVAYQTLAQLNNIPAPYTVYPGQVLALP